MEKEEGFYGRILIFLGVLDFVNFLKLLEFFFYLYFVSFLESFFFNWIFIRGFRFGLEVEDGGGEFKNYRGR